jgi:hypothetical protein
VHEGVYVNNAKIFASCCWVHVRRKFFAARLTYPSLVASALGVIHRLYEIDDRARDLSAEERRALLAYNGCVRGTNTPNCHTYPNKVRDLRERVRRDWARLDAAEGVTTGGRLAE